VSGSRKLNQADKEKFNLYYLKNYSFLLDLEILIKALFLH
jgi:lipopolysaccharide/colanic/teichoic acid biosynthesis glycosyltransferase